MSEENLFFSEKESAVLNNCAGCKGLIPANADYPEEVTIYYPLLSAKVQFYHKECYLKSYPRRICQPLRAYKEMVMKL